MEQLVNSESLQVWMTTLIRPYTFQSPFKGDSFVLAIFAQDPLLTQDEQNRIANEIVAAGCRYAVCAGLDCSQWDDAIDWAYLGTDPDFSPPADRFVMTTWHENQQTEEVVWFALHCTSFDGRHCGRYLIALVGADAEVERAAREEVARAMETGWNPTP